MLLLMLSLAAWTAVLLLVMGLSMVLVKPDVI